MTAVKGFGWKWTAVYSLETIVFGITQHKTGIQSTMTLGDHGGKAQVLAEVACVIFAALGGFHSLKVVRF